MCVYLCFYVHSSLQHFHSIVLLAVADARYRFIYVNIGAYGHEGDSTLFALSDFGKRLYAEQLDLPDDAMIGNEKLPFFVIGDDAFAMGRRLIKPFVPLKGARLTEDQRIFNYRLSRARRVVENAFGIMASKWRVLSRTMTCNPERAKKIVNACFA